MERGPTWEEAVPTGRDADAARSDPARSPLEALARAVGNEAMTGATLARANNKKRGATRGRPKKQTRGVKKPPHRQKQKRQLHPVIPPRRSTRDRRAPNAVDQEVYWAGPAYGAEDPLRGGVSVTADLGPASGIPTNYGSGPGPQSCTAVNWLNANAYGGHPWIKGHLLNDNLGGPGVSRNLTPMTHNANMDMKNRFESRVKNLITACYSKAILSRRPTHYYGVRWSVTVVGQTWPHDPNPAVRAVAHHVLCSAQYIRRPVAGGPVELLAADPGLGVTLPAGVVQVDCVQ